MLTKHMFSLLPLAQSTAALTMPRSASEAARLAREQNGWAQQERDRERRERQAFGDRLRQLERDIAAGPGSSVRGGMIDADAIYQARAKRNRP